MPTVPVPIVSLGDLVESMKNGIYRPASSYSDDGLACLRMYNIDEGRIVWRDIKRMRLTESEIREYELQPGDLLVNRVNSRELVGKTAVIPEGLERCIFESKNIRVRVRRDLVEPKFAGFALLSAGRSHFDRNAQQVVGMASISQPQVASFKLPLPPLSEQRRLVAEIEKQFTRLDAGIAALRRTQANLKRYRAAVLKAACEGCLVPTEAELANQQSPKRGSIPREGGTHRFESGATLLERMLIACRKNWLGRRTYKEPTMIDAKMLHSLPDGWAWASMRQVGEVQLGRQRAPQHHSGDNMRPYLRVANVFEARIDTNDVKEMNFTPVEFERYRLKFGDILLNEGQTPELVGRSAMFRDEIAACCYQKTLLRFRAYEGVLPHFALTVFRGYMHNRRFTRAASITTNIAHLTAEKFVEIEFPLPPLAEQSRIVAEVERRLSIVDELETIVNANLQRATRLRRSILQQAFSGRMVVSSSTRRRSLATGAFCRPIMGNTAEL